MRINRMGIKVDDGTDERHNALTLAELNVGDKLRGVVALVRCPRLRAAAQGGSARECGALSVIPLQTAPHRRSRGHTPYVAMAVVDRSVAPQSLRQRHRGCRGDVNLTVVHPGDRQRVSDSENDRADEKSHNAEGDETAYDAGKDQQ
jgi:hypothetical protein